MDVNGTRFHLIKGRADWRRCREDGESGAGDFRRLHFDEGSRVMRLASQLVLFVSARGGSQLPLEARRGAAADAFGNWYWIGNDRQKIYWRPLGSKKSRVFWSQKAEPPACAPSGDFAPVVEEAPQPLDLAGLAVTSRHYLVVGDTARRGIFVFDLHAGGPPLLFRFPAGVPFEPFDMAPAPRGGVWILDRTNRAYWGLDRDFCVMSEGAEGYEIAPEEEEVFHVEAGTAAVRPAKLFPRGFEFPADVEDPVAVEGMPDGSVLILDSPAYLGPAPSPPPPSRVHQFRLGTRVAGPFELSDPDIETVDELTGRVSRGLAAVGYDFAFAPADEGGRRGTLHVVEREGNQSIAFTLDLEASPDLVRITPEFRPMHFFGSRALVQHRGRLFYDVVSGDTANDRAVRWTELQGIDEQRYPARAALVSHTLDGRERGCVWHRLFLDACIPAESRVEVWSRASDDAALLEQVEWSPEPGPYLRGAGAELPYFNAFPQYAPGELPENTGTWELLFQEARGRFMQLRLVLSGNGRSSPHLHSVRAYYPRFSYPRNYLPGVYQEDAGSAHFLERMLANEEGFYTEIEGRIHDVSALFDARSAPPETLDWLAGWVGIVLDPLWADIQRERQTQITSLFPSRRGPFDRRRLFIRFARRLYDRRGTPAGIHFALLLLLDPCLEVTLARMKRAAVRPEDPKVAGLLEELKRYGLAAPHPSMSEEEFEDLLYDYVLAPRRPSKVRVVERYRTRGGRRLQEGDSSVGGEQPNAEQEAPDAFAHQFSVLVPEALTPEEEAMVRRIAELEKPAHTLFDVRRYWDFFRVGETRLGIDTVLGEESRFVETIIGRSYLAEGYLHPSHPADVGERVVSDRDRLGDMPSL